MSEEWSPKDPGSVWRGQPEEKLAVRLEQFASRRTKEFYASTRSEILAGIGAAVFFAAIIEWRFLPFHDRLLQAGLAAILAWGLISLYWFRDRIWRKVPAQDALAAAGLDYYRGELERRRDHLKNAWIWHGPLVLACLVFAGVMTREAFPKRLVGVAPLGIVLLVWTAYGIRRRWRQARELQREIEELGAGAASHP